MNAKALFAIPLLAASLAVHASVINYEFDLHVNTFVLPPSSPGYPIDPFLQVGRTYIGVFSVDSSVLDQDGDYRPGLVSELHISFDGWQEWDETPTSPLVSTTACFSLTGYHPCSDQAYFWGILVPGGAPYTQGFTFDVVNGEIAAIRGYLGSSLDIPSLDFSVGGDSSAWDLDAPPIGIAVGDMTLHRLPEPPTFALVLVGLLGVGVFARRQSKT